MKHTLKKKLRNGELAVGSWVTIGHPAIAEIMCLAGLDFVTIDLEHSTINIETAGEMIRTVALAGSAPLVRLSDNCPVLIKRVMDAGAHGIIVPMVNNAKEAIKASQAMHYPPKGTRGTGLARAQGYGTSFQEYRSFLETETLLIAQIEHKDAIDNLEEILAIEEVDGIIVGPYDLSASLGIPGKFDHPLFKTELNRIEQSCLKTKVALGTHLVEPDNSLAKTIITKGYSLIAYSLDIRILDTCIRQGLTNLHFVRNKGIQ